MANAAHRGDDNSGDDIRQLGYDTVSVELERQRRRTHLNLDDSRHVESPAGTPWTTPRVREQRQRLYRERLVDAYLDLGSDRRIGVKSHNPVDFSSHNLNEFMTQTTPSPRILTLASVSRPHRTIALHLGAGVPEIFVSCAQIEVTGFGTGNVSIPDYIAATGPISSHSEGGGQEAAPDLLPLHLYPSLLLLHAPPALFTPGPLPNIETAPRTPQAFREGAVKLFDDLLKHAVLDADVIGAREL
ncbi:hypothetical protein D9611_007953 [Ephemerocybe angulata]|uniref:Uncharacterized protein n=1 Tax=Ephemerocybe angulata TaxID=980116 RepID=A0A8H5FKR6_9AGAR|nr:hypothetical protein D9611_007953 [Tulosesus angulatus]